MKKKILLLFLLVIIITAPSFAGIKITGNCNITTINFENTSAVKVTLEDNSSVSNTNILAGAEDVYLEVEANQSYGNITTATDSKVHIKSSTIFEDTSNAEEDTLKIERASSENASNIGNVSTEKTNVKGDGQETIVLDYTLKANESIWLIKADKTPKTLTEIENLTFKENITLEESKNITKKIVTNIEGTYKIAIVDKDGKVFFAIDKVNITK